MIDESSVAKGPAPIIPALGPIYRVVAPYGYLVLRLGLAFMFLPSGIDKVFEGGYARIAEGNLTKVLGMSFPYAWAWTVAGLELVGAILIGLGLFTRPVAFALFVELFVITFGIMSLRGFLWTTGGMEVAMLMGVVSFGFVLGGGGRFSLDRWLGKEF